MLIGNQLKSSLFYIYIYLFIFSSPSQGCSRGIVGWWKPLRPSAAAEPASPLAQSGTSGPRMRLSAGGDAGGRTNRRCRVLLRLAGRRKKNKPHNKPQHLLAGEAGWEKNPHLYAIISQVLSRDFVSELRMKAELFIQVIYSRFFFFFLKL